MTTNLTGNSDPSFIPGGVPDLVVPHLKWDESDYASLEGRMDFYGDFIALYKCRNGQITEYYPAIDPDEAAAAIGNVNLTSGLLPRECLFWGKLEGTDRIGIYIPPQVWPVVVRDEPLPTSTHPAAAGQAWRVPLPGLIFVGHSYDYSLWAVTERPAVESAPLYLAPCPNVSLKGVCRGNAPFPKAAPATIWQAVEVFFGSKFNQDLANGKSRSHPGNILDQWRALNQAGAETYPLEDLVLTDITLRRLVHYV
jgi:hypothetical protein